MLFSRIPIYIDTKATHDWHHWMSGVHVSTSRAVSHLMASLHAVSHCDTASVTHTRRVSNLIDAAIGQRCQPEAAKHTHTHSDSGRREPLLSNVQTSEPPPSPPRGSVMNSPAHYSHGQDTLHVLDDFSLPATPGAGAGAAAGAAAAGRGVADGTTAAMPRPPSPPEPACDSPA